MNVKSDLLRILYLSWSTAVLQSAPREQGHSDPYESRRKPLSPSLTKITVGTLVGTVSSCLFPLQLITLATLDYDKDFGGGECRGGR